MTMIEHFAQGARLSAEQRARSAAREQYGDIAGDRGLFSVIEQAKQMEANRGFREQELDLERQREQRAGQAQDFELGTAQEDRKRQAVLGIVNGLRQARDSGQDLGAAFDKMVPTLQRLGIDPNSFPEMRQSVIDDPGLLDNLHATLTGETRAERATQYKPRKTANDAEKIQRRQELRDRGARTVLRNVQRLEDQINEGFIPVTGGMGTQLMQSIPGSPMRRAAGWVQTLEARLSFDELQAMREASPTGGALGQVSNYEIDLLKSALENLDMARDKQTVLESLQVVKMSYLDIMFGQGNWELLPDGSVIATNPQTGEQYRVEGTEIEPYSPEQPAEQPAEQPPAITEPLPTGTEVPGFGTVTGYNGGPPGDVNSYTFSE